MIAIAGERYPTASGALPAFAFVLLGVPPAAWVAVSTACAQDLEPRAYTNTPVGINFLLAGYAYQEGDVATDPSLPLEDAQVHVHTALVAYVATRIGGDFDIVGLLLRYRWGGGL